jgi:hypothetical protein
MNYGNATYVKIGCFEAHANYFAYFRDAACTQPIYSTGNRALCETSQYQTQCVAEITPLPTSDPSSPTEPTSAASTAQLPLFLGLLVVVIASFTAL